MFSIFLKIKTSFLKLVIDRVSRLLSLPSERIIYLSLQELRFLYPYSLDFLHRFYILQEVESTDSERNW